jgi:hypothetical protein
MFIPQQIHESFVQTGVANSSKDKKEKKLAIIEHKNKQKTADPTTF